VNKYYDRDGNPMDMMDYSRQFANMEYKRVKETTLPDGTWISTVWLGIDHHFGDGPPLIFETMVFSSQEDMADHDCERYSTLAEAEAGHTAMVAKWKEARDAGA